MRKFHVWFMLKNTKGNKMLKKKVHYHLISSLSGLQRFYLWKISSNCFFIISSPCFTLSVLTDRTDECFHERCMATDAVEMYHTCHTLSSFFSFIHFNHFLSNAINKLQSNSYNHWIFYIIKKTMLVCFSLLLLQHHNYVTKSAFATTTCIKQAMETIIVCM